MKRRASIRTYRLPSSIRAVVMLADWVRGNGVKVTVSLTFILLAAYCATSVPNVHAWLLGGAALQQAEPEISSSNFTSFNVSGSGSGALQGTLGIGIDAAGDIAGVYLDGNYVAHGFVRAASAAVTTFDAPGAGTTSSIKGSLVSLQGTVPTAINAAGTIVGTYLDTHSCYHGFLRAASGTITEFDVSGAVTNAACTPQAASRVGTRPIAINSTGTIIGTYSDTSGKYHGFVRAANGGVTTFDAPPVASISCSSCGTVPTTIDTAGDIAGYYSDSNGRHYGFVYPANGAITAFSVSNSVANINAEESDYEGTLALCMNDSGTVAGTYTDANVVRHGFIRSASGATTSFDIPGAGTGGPGNHIHEGTAGISIDAAGDVVGTYLDANAAYHGFLRSASGAITTIDAPGAGANALAGTVAFHTNDTGQIAGAYVDSGMAIHAFLLALPVTATSTPTFSPASGAYASAQTVTISDTTPGALIYYTTNGTTPTPPSNPYTGAITVGSSETLKAIAVAAGYAQSAVATATYSITAGSPVLTLSTNNLNFGSVITQGNPLPAGTPTTAQTLPLTATNTGTANLTISAVTINGANAGDFATSADTCSGTTVAPGGACTVNVVFTPTAASSRSATLTISSGISAPQVALAGTGMNVFYQFGAASAPPETGVPQCFDLVPGSVQKQGAGCSQPPSGDTTNEGYETQRYGCALASTAAVLSTFSGFSNITPSSLDTGPPITLPGNGGDPEKGLYSPPGSGDMHWCSLPQFLEACSVDSQDVVGGGESCQTASPGESLNDYLTQHIVNKLGTSGGPDRIILQLCETWLGSCPSSNNHYISVVGSDGSGDWYVFDPGWRTTSADSPNIYTLSGHEQGFLVGSNLRSFQVTGMRTFSASASATSLCVQAQSPVELLVANSQGQLVGNVSSGTDTSEIAQSSYFRDFPIADDSGSASAIGDPNGLKTAFIPNASDGPYTVTAMGTASGPYTLDIRGVASDGSVQEATVSGAALAGSTSRYQITYSPTPGTSLTVTPLLATPAVTVTPSASSITTAQALTVTVAVSGTPTPTGTVTLSSGAYTSAATTLSGGSAQIGIPAGSLATGSDTLTASYTPDSSSSTTYNSVTGSNSVTVTTVVSPSFSLSGTAVSVAPGATTGNTSTISVTPLGGFTGSVALTAAIASSPNGAQYPPTLSFGATSPVSITGTSAGTATLTISTTAPTSAALVYPKRPGVPWYATGGATLACLLLFGIPTRRRSWRTMLGLLALLAFLAGGVLSCGGGGGGGGGGGNPGTTAGAYTITVTGTSGTTTATGTVILTVQ